MSISLTGSGLTLSASGTVTLNGGGFSPFGTLPNASFVSGYSIGTSSGNSDIYTVPAGRRAYICNLYTLNTSGTNCSFQMQIKISGTYYPLNAGTGFSIGNQNTCYSSAVVPYVAEAGETLAVNCSQASFTTWAAIVEFDDTSTLYTSKVTSMVNGNNTVYTAPASTTSLLVSQSMFGSNGSTGGGSNSGTSGSACFCFSNVSGANRTVSWNLVPSGGTVGSTNDLTGGTQNSGSGTVLYQGIPLTLNAGDFVNVSTSSAAAGQLAWVTVVEL